MYVARIYLTGAVRLERVQHGRRSLQKQPADVDGKQIVVALFHGYFVRVAQLLRQRGAMFLQLGHVQENGRQLVGVQKAGHHHRPVKLLGDDVQVPAVLLLRLHDFRDDLPPLGPPFVALPAHQRGEHDPATDVGTLQNRPVATTRSHPQPRSTVWLTVVRLYDENFRRSIFKRPVLWVGGWRGKRFFEKESPPFVFFFFEKNVFRLKDASIACLLPFFGLVPEGCNARTERNY